MNIPTEKGPVKINGEQVIFDESRLRLLVRRIAQLGEIHDHSALAEIMDIGLVIKKDHEA